MAKRKPRQSFPLHLPLLETMKCEGKLIVKSREDGGWAVQYDVKTPDGTWVYDRRILTTDQIVKWTGVDPTDRLLKKK